MKCTRLVLLSMLSLPATLHAQQTEHVALNGNRIAIFNIAGRIHVTGGNGSASADIVRHGRDASKLRVVTSMLNGQEALRVLYPADRISVPGDRNRNTRTEMRVRDDGTFGNTREARSERGSREHSDRSGRSIRISDDRNGLEASADIEVRVPNGVSLRINLGAGEIIIGNINGDLAVDASSANLTARDVKGRVDFDLGSGQSILTNLTGSVLLDAGSGDVTVQNLTGPLLSLESGSGTMTVDGSSADRTVVSTGSGSLHLRGIRSRTLALDTGSGSVQVGLLMSPELITIDSGSGDIALTLPANFAASLQVETGSGGIKSEFPVQFTSKAHDRMNGRIGTGGGRVTIETGSGSVRLIKGN